MVSDICASVPFMLGDIDSGGWPKPEEKRVALGGYLLIWPLQVARWSVDQGSEEETWIIEKLNFIAQKMGIRSARSLALKARTEPWRLT